MITALETGSVSDLLSAVAWPVVALVIAALFRSSLRDLLTRDEVDIRGPAGLGLSAKRSAEAATALSRAAAKQPSQDFSPGDISNGIATASANLSSLGRDARILWVDDVPSNNIYERAALQALGVVIDLSTSTGHALQMVQQRGPYDLVISDMRRPPDDAAGYTLLQSLRQRGDLTPFVIYAGPGAKDYSDEAVRRGAVGSTDSPTELIDLVSGVLRSTASRNAAQKFPVGTTRWRLGSRASR